MEFPPYRHADACAAMLRTETEQDTSGGQQAPAPPSAAGEGFLDRLPQRAPQVLQSRCESLFAFIGYPSPDKLLIESRYRGLMRLCAGLPRSKPAWPELNGRLEQLHQDLGGIQGRSFEPTQRFELLDEVCRMEEEARLLLFSLYRKGLRKEEEDALLRKHAPGATQWMKPSTLSARSSLVSDSLEDSEPEPGLEFEPVFLPVFESGLRQRMLPPSHPQFMAAAPLPDPLPDPMPFSMDARRIANLKAVLQRAWDRTDGKGQIEGRHAAALFFQLLKVAGADIRYFTDQSPEMSGKYLDLREVLQQALDLMPETRMKAIAHIAWEYLEELQP